MRRQVIVAPGYVRDGHLKAAKREAFAALLQKMTNCAVVIRIEESRDPRSAALNAYYWGAVIEAIVEETGYTDREAHREMKALHLPLRFAAERANGTIKDLKVFEGSTTVLSNDEEWEYIENIQRWAAGSPLFIVIPDPVHV